MKNRIFVLAVINALFFVQINAQNECLNVVSTANVEYQNGRLKKCIEKLEHCFSQLESKEERIEGYRLLALSYFSLNETEKLHQNIVLLLEEKPEYAEQSFGRDPLEFSKEVASYSVNPKWTVGIIMGIVSNQVKVVENHQAFGLASSIYSSRPSYLIGGRVQRSLNDHLYIAGSINALGSNVYQELKLSEEATQSYQERSNMIGLGIDLGFQYPLNKKNSVQLSLKTAYNRMYSDIVNIDQFTEQEVINQQSFDQLARRVEHQPSVGLGIGYEHKMFVGYISIGASYSSFINSTMNKDELYNDVEFNLSTLYNNDLVKLRQLSFVLRYQYPLNFHINKSSD